MHHAILYISLSSLHPCDVKLPNFYTLALWSRWTQHKSSLFPLLNLNTVLSDSTGGNFANNCQIKWNWIRSKKFEEVRIHFLSDVFGLLWSKNFAAMATWRNDFSSLLYVNEIHDVIGVNVFFPPANDIPAQKGLIGPYYTTNGRSPLLIGMHEEICGRIRTRIRPVDKYFHQEVRSNEKTDRMSAGGVSL